VFFAILVFTAIRAQEQHMKQDSAQYFTDSGAVEKIQKMPK